MKKEAIMGKRLLRILLIREGDLLVRRFFFEVIRFTGESSSRWDLLGKDLKYDGKSGLDALNHILDVGTESQLDDFFTNKSARSIGEVLFDTLFGAQETWVEGLRNFFEIDSHFPDPHPTQRGLRVQVMSEDPLLRGLPWKLARWKSTLLLDVGWSFETTDVEHKLDTVVVPEKCSILVVAPNYVDEKPIGTHSHIQSIREIMASYSEIYRGNDGYLKVVGNRLQIEDALRNGGVDLLYFYGHGKLQSEELSLVVENAEDIEKSDHVQFEDLKRWMNGRYPKIAYFNGSHLGMSGNQSAFYQLEEVPIVIANRTAALMDQAGEQAISWFRRVFVGLKNPVSTLHKLTVTQSSNDFKWAMVSTHVRCERCLIQRPSGVVRPYSQFNPLSFDREMQRAQTIERVTRLVKSKRSAEAIVAYGDAGTLVEEHSEQLVERLNQLFSHHLRTKSIVALLPDGDLDSRRLREELFEAFKVTMDGDLQTTMRKWAPSIDYNITPIIWIDWRPHHTKSASSMSTADLKDWLVFCQDELPRYCPFGMRIVSFIGLEVNMKDYDEFGTALKRCQTEFIGPRFECSILPVLSRVEEIDIIRFLLESPSHTKCPEDLIPRIAHLLIRATGGVYSEVMKWFRKGSEETSWAQIHEELERFQ